MVELGDAGRYFGDEVAAGLGQPDAAMATLEQQDTERLLQPLDPGADA